VNFNDKILDTLFTMIDKIESDEHNIVVNLKEKNKTLTHNVQNAFALLVDNVKYTNK
jgi:hypothetical protein